uniref:Uncharacterized protein n=1 Tax=Oryza sativa subsp. japonica TaxID=39947 RepID=Q6YUW9_ORYSJ|nr:hypothetical protein [Oryza sativa Japonica Group]
MQEAYKGNAWSPRCGGRASSSPFPHALPSVDLVAVSCSASPTLSSSPRSAPRRRPRCRREARRHTAGELSCRFDPCRCHCPRRRSSLARWGKRGEGEELEVDAASELAVVALIQ